MPGDLGRVGLRRLGRAGGARAPTVRVAPARTGPDTAWCPAQPPGAFDPVYSSTMTAVFVAALEMVILGGSDFVPGVSVTVSTPLR